MLKQHLAPMLEKRGFAGKAGHWVRRFDVFQVVEVQHSIYGKKITVNLGIDLPWLPPAARWIPRPARGPHAHDCLRWVRIGRLLEEPEDRWWSYELKADADVAGEEITELIERRALVWLEHESERPSFLEYAKERLERSKGPRAPEGRYLELRMLAAVLAWNHLFDQAHEVVELSRAAWPDAREKLSAARRTFGEKHKGASLVGVPNLPRELDDLIESLDEVGTVAQLPAIED